MSGAQVRLACAKPGENVAVFGDALSELVHRSGHLRAENNAYWFGSQPTLRKLAEARAQELSDADADDAVIAVLKADERSKGGFARVHTCALTPEDAEESNAVALVVLHPNFAHDPRTEGSLAVATAIDVLKRRGGGRLRQARNTLIFVAANSASLIEVRKIAKMKLAWRSIQTDASLDLKDSQRQEAEREATAAASALEASVRRAWSQVFYPAPPTVEGEPFSLARAPINNPGQRSVAAAVWDRVRVDEIVLEKLGRQTLSERLKEAWPPGDDHVRLDMVRDWFVQYVRFDRLRDEVVLSEAISELIRDGLSDFAWAEGIGGDGRYLALALGKVVAVRFDGDAMVVRREAALAQLNGGPQPAPGAPGGGPAPGRPGIGEGGEPPPPTARRLRRFTGVVDLDPNRPIKDLQPIMDSVVTELLRTQGVTVTLRLEIDAVAPDGFETDDAAVVRDNARTLKFKAEDTRFSED